MFLNASANFTPLNASVEKGLAALIEWLRYRIPLLRQRLGHALTQWDIAAIRRTQRALEVSEARYRGLFDNAIDIVYTHDLNGVFTSINRSGERITGYSVRNGTQVRLDQVVAPDQRGFALKMLTQRQPDPSNTNFEIDVLTADGRRLTVEVNSRLMFEDGKPIEVQGIARDVTEARANTKRLAQMVAQLGALQQAALSLNSVHDLEALLREILAGVRHLNSPDEATCLVLNAEGSSFAVRAHVTSGGELEVTGVESAPSHLTRTILGERRARFVESVARESAHRCPEMSKRTRAYAALPLHTPERLLGMLYVTYYQPCVFSNEGRQLLQIMANHAAVAIANVEMLGELKRAATTDPLTGLPNHRYLMDRLDEEMARARRSGHPLTVMMFDIDGFKLINDTHGHPAGDELLRLVAHTLREALRSTDILGRYGGDEFMAMLPETGRGEVPNLVERVLASVESQEFRVRSRTSPSPRPVPSKSNGAGNKRSHTMKLPIRVSVGAAVFPIDSANRLELISLADSAMYASKRAGSNRLTMAHSTDSGFLAAQNNTFSVLEGLVNAVDGKDHYTRAHSEHVARFALVLAESLGIEAQTKRLIRIAALLHDVGKIGIPDHVLRKPGPLDSKEQEMVRQHPLLSEMIMRETPHLTDVLDAVRHHHERYDGRGYPRGLRGEGIPYIARILCIADSFSAMITDRPYRKALPLGDAFEELRQGAGSQFDPALVEPFIDTVLSSLDLGQAAGVRVPA